MRRISTILRAIALAAVLSGAACASDGATTADEQAREASSEPDETRTTPETTAVTPPPTIAVEVGAPTLWELLLSVDDLSSYRKAVVAAGLQSLFEDCSTAVTVFAPKNFSIEMMEDTFGSGVLSAHLEQGEVEELRSFVLDHIVDAAYDNQSFASAATVDIELETLDGRPLRIVGGDPGSIRRVLLRDQFATQPLLGCNGALHPTSWVIGY